MAKSEAKKQEPKKESPELKAVAHAPKKELVAQVQGGVSDFFEESQSDSSDIIIPKLLLMQGISSAVADEKASSGDIINSVTLEVLGNKQKPLEIIPIKIMPKTWVIEQKIEGRWTYKGIKPWQPQDKDLPWNYVENGQEMRRNQSLNFFVLLAKDATNPTALPFMISFRRTSYVTGKKFNTYFETSRMAFVMGNKQSIPMANVFNLGSKMEKGELGPYHILTIDLKRVATQAELEAGQHWFKTLKAAAVQVDEAEVRGVADDTGITPGQLDSTHEF